MRDELLLRRSDLRPLRLDTAKDGLAYVHLDYNETGVAGWKMVAGQKQAIQLTFPGPVWDGNLWGLTFAAMPLKEGGRYTLPEYQYDNGLGEFAVTVKGSQPYPAPGGTVEAWSIDAGTTKDEHANYLIQRTPPGELGFEAGTISQAPGGDCSGLH